MGKIPEQEPQSSNGKELRDDMDHLNEVERMLATALVVGEQKSDEKDSLGSNAENLDDLGDLADELGTAIDRLNSVLADLFRP